MMPRSLCATLLRPRTRGLEPLARNNLPQVLISPPSSTSGIVEPSPGRGVRWPRWRDPRYGRSFASSTEAERPPIHHTSAPAPDLPPNFLFDLRSAIPGMPISTNRYDLDTHGKGESYHPSVPPRAVLSPRSTDEVAEIVKRCAADGVPVIPYGSGTSLEGHVAAVRGGVCLDLTSLDEIRLPADGPPEDAHVQVGAGVTRRALNQALRHTGLQFMVDPGADATLGGMAACGASGTAAVKYGTMRENVLGMEVVLPDGTAAKCGTDAIKSSAGYDLTSLMIGSEGTLGVITEVTVRLHPVPNHIVAAVCSFGGLHGAAEAVAAMRMCGVDLERCELLDGASIGAFNAWRSGRGGDSEFLDGGTGSTMEEKPTLFLEFTGPSQAAVDEHVAMARSICADDCYGGSEFKFTDTEEERKRLWSARHSLYYATLALRPGASGAVVTDACTPLSKFADLITATAEDVKKYNVVGPCFGHAGDGNFHCILPLLESDPQDYIDRVHKVNENLIEKTIAVGGTCTGEHGVGYGKIKYLWKQYGKGGVEFMRLIKRGVDPRNIMNPEKVVYV